MLLAQEDTTLIMVNSCFCIVAEFMDEIITPVVCACWSVSKREGGLAFHFRKKRVIYNFGGS